MSEDSGRKFSKCGAAEVCLSDQVLLNNEQKLEISKPKEVYHS